MQPKATPEPRSMRTCAISICPRTLLPKSPPTRLVLTGASASATFTNADGSERDDADGLRAEIRRLCLESRIALEMKRNGHVN